MEQVYKGLMGCYKAVDEKHGCTHCILTFSEYNQLINERDNARAETRQIISQANKEMEQCKRITEQRVLQIKEEASERVQAISSNLKVAEDEIDRLNDLNQNLLRISKERANAKRGLKPKKEHGGYVVLFSQQYDYRDGNRIYKVWKTVLQTPHDASIPLEDIRPLVNDDLIQTFGGALGLKEVVKIFDHIDWDEEKNTLFNRIYKANFRSGFWEVEYLHTQPIQVPVDMRI